MDTITKSTRKSLLAVAVVALMALVAVAGVVTYDADNSDAADSDYSYLEGGITVSSKEAASNIYIPTQNAVKDSSVTVPEGVTFTGTITFGYHNTVAGVNYDVPFTALTFEGGITDVTVTYHVAVKDAQGTVTTPAYVSISSNSATAASVNMTVASGAVTVEGITGTVTAAGETVTLENASGLTVAVAEGKAILVGTVTAGTVTVNGDFVAGTIAVTEDAVMTIAKDATVTAVAKPNNTYGFTFTAPTGVDATTIDITLLDGNAAAHSTQSTGTTTKVSGLNNNTCYKMTVDYPVMKNTTTTSTINETTVYDVVVSDGKYYLFPTAAVSDASAGVITYDATAKTYSFSINTGDTKFAASETTVQVYNDSSFTALLDGTNFNTYVKCNAGVVTISIPASVAFVVSDTKDSTILSFTVNGNTLLYTLNATKAADDSVSYTLTQADKVVATVTDGKDATVTAAAPDPVTITLNGADAVLNVEGTFDASATKYTYTASGATTATTVYIPVSFMTTPATGGTAATTLVAGTINITGKAIFQETDWTTMPMSVAAAAVTVNAVTYAVAPQTADETTGMITCYAGNFATALAESVAMTDNVQITVFGEVDVTADATIPAQTTDAKHTVTFELGQGSHPACLNVGTADTEVVLTVAATGDGAVNTIVGLNVIGCINVVNGAFKVAALDTDDEAVYGYVPASAAGATTTVIEHGVNAAVFMTEKVGDVTYGIFTDLASALITAKASAETEDLVLRTDANIVKDCELSAEDTLDLAGHSVIVGDKDVKGACAPTLTLNGVVSNSVTPASGINGIAILPGATVNLNLDTADTFTGFLVFGGTLNYAADVTFANAQAAAIIGNLNVNGTVTADVSFFNMSVSYEDERIVTAAGLKELQKTYADGLILNVTVPGEMTLLGDSTSAAIGSGDIESTILNLDVTGTLNLSGNFVNSYTMNFTLGTDGKILMPTDDVTLTNSGVLTLNLAGTIAYDEDGHNLTITSGGLTAGISGAVAESFVMNVTGSVALKSLTAMSAKDVVTVSGAGVLSTAETSNVLSLTVSDSAKVLLAAGSTITTATVTGTATLGLYVAPTAGIGTVNASEYVSVTTMVIGTASQKLAENVNGAAVSGVYLSTSAIVYGTAANVAFANAAELVNTVMYMAGDENVLYATQYSVKTVGTTTAAGPLALPALNEVEGYSFNGWFDARVGGNTISNSAKIGDFTGIYAQFTIKTYTLTLSYVEGAVYLVNGNQLASGTYQYDYNTALKVSVIAADGYSADKATVTVGTGAAQTESTFNIKEDTTVTAAGLTAVSTDDGGLSLTDILLIVLVIITAIVAVAVVLKLARS